MILDIHTHRRAPYPEGVISVAPEEFEANLIPGQLYSVGIHPWTTGEDVPDQLWRNLEEAAENPQVAAIGECGIDMVKGGPLFRQMLVFKRQALLSEQVGKPLVIHCVKSHDVVIGIYKEIKPVQPWLIHGFRGKPSVAAMIVKTGINLSFGSLFNEETVSAMPENMIFAETDEASVSIDEVIARLSDSRRRLETCITATESGKTEMRDIISANTARFLHIEVHE